MKIIDKKDVKENQIETFSNELFGEVRVLEIDNRPYAIANDVLKALGYEEGSYSTTLSRKCKKDGVTKCKVIDKLGRNQEANAIDEGNIYRLIIGSKLQSAEKFEYWVFDEVLPAIRQTGGYIPHSEDMSDEEIMARALQVAQKTIDKKNQQLKVVEEENIKLAGIIESQKPKLDYLDEILSCEDALLVTSIAFDYGLSAQSLNKILCEERVQRKVRNQYILYSDYLGKGYTKTETKIIGDKPRVQTLWTQKGRMLIHDILGKRKIKALMDLELAEA